MLSYLKDANELPAASDMPDGGDETSKTTDYMTVSGHRQKVRQSTIVLVVLFAVSALVVWFMIKKTTPAKATAATTEDQAQLDTALAQLSNMRAEMDSKEMDAVTDRFYQFHNVDQVAVDELKKNPFTREVGYKNDPGGAESQEAEQIRQEAQVISVGLELWSITATPKGMCCMIDDKVLYQGDTYKGMTVESIEEKVVTLSYKGVPIKLKLD